MEETNQPNVETLADRWYTEGIKNWNNSVVTRTAPQEMRGMYHGANPREYAGSHNMNRSILEVYQRH